MMIMKRKLVLGDEAARLQVHQKSLKKGMTAVYRHVRMQSARKGEKSKSTGTTGYGLALQEVRTEKGRQVNSKICIRKLLQTPTPPYRNQSAEKQNMMY